MDLRLSRHLHRKTVNAKIDAVGMLIGPRALKSLNSIEKIQARLMIATFNSNPITTMISCHRRTNVSEETDIIAFLAFRNTTFSS